MTRFRFYTGDIMVSYVLAFKYAEMAMSGMSGIPKPPLDILRRIIPKALAGSWQPMIPLRVSRSLPENHVARGVDRLGLMVLSQ
jgi:hypothetical protein